MPTSIKIRGIAPPELAGLPTAYRRQFWELVAPIALRVKDQELAAGLDASGEPLRPISPRTRRYRKSAMVPGGKGDPAAPPLMPARGKSRTRALLAARALPDHVELYWRFDPFTGDQWSRILTFQRDNGRDVFGVSEDGLKKIRIQSWAAWTKWKKTQVEPVERRGAFASHAVASGLPQSRIAVTIANSARPGAGAAAGIPRVGTTVRETITRGIGAPKRVELAAGRYSGGKTAVGIQRYFTEEVRLGKGGGAVVVRPPRPGPIKPTTAKAATKPAKPKPYAIEFHGSLPDDIKRNHRERIEKLPPPVLRALRRGGVKFVYAERLIDAYPELASERPSGWSGGDTWENCEGVYMPARKEIFVARKRRLIQPPEYRVSDRQAGALNHETGHGLDAALGLPSREQRWQDAYEKDAAKLTDEEKRYLAYYLQVDYRGSAEAFAELFAFEMGEGAQTIDLRPFFPECLKVLREILGGLEKS
jgi:hypothetical protein